VSISTIGPSACAVGEQEFRVGQFEVAKERGLPGIRLVADFERRSKPHGDALERRAISDGVVGGFEPHQRSLADGLLG